MIIKCPKCNAGIDEIAMSATICCCGVSYDEDTDQFTAEADSDNVEEVQCSCMECGHEWEWDAYRRNCVPVDQQKISEAFTLLPVNTPEFIKDDLKHRITDWLESGGDVTDEYIQRQIKFAESYINFAKKTIEEAVPCR